MDLAKEAQLGGWHIGSEHLKRPLSLSLSLSLSPAVGPTACGATFSTGWTGASSTTSSPPRTHRGWCSRRCPTLAGPSTSGEVPWDGRSTGLLRFGRVMDSLLEAITFSVTTFSVTRYWRPVGISSNGGPLCVTLSISLLPSHLALFPLSPSSPSPSRSSFSSFLLSIYLHASFLPFPSTFFL